MKIDLDNSSPLSDEEYDFASVARVIRMYEQKRSAETGVDVTGEFDIEETNIS